MAVAENPARRHFDVWDTQTIFEMGERTLSAVIGVLAIFVGIMWLIFWPSNSGKRQ